MRYFCVLLILWGVIFSAKAQQNYAVSLIPKDLLSHASSVVRNSETTLEVKGLNNVVCHFKTAVTIMNKNGDNDARLVVWHDNDRHINYIKGAVYNEFGMLNGKISERDFTDQNVADGFSLFEDTKVKHYRPVVTVYPYTVEYDYQTTDKQSLMLEGWESGQDVGTSVHHSAYKLICKPDFKIRYKELNYPGKVVTGTEQGLVTYSWSADNLTALRSEPYSPQVSETTASVKIAPEQFNYEGIAGSFNDWNEYGQWIYDKLLKSRKQLPPETVAHIKEMTQNITDPKQKAKVIYNYMQQKTRYVSVQIGIGGFQPFLASDVDQQSYGDCKALVNYTQSLLSAANIDSYYVLVKSGRHKSSAMPNFASMTQFDHVILCLPFKNDTTWLECTDQNIPFGYLGDFTDDRNVIACTPNGGKLMHTPVYKTQDNTQLRKGNFSLNGDGTLDGEMVTRFEGSQYDNRNQLVNEGHKEQMRMLKDIYPVENLDIQNFDLNQNKSLKPITTETIKLQVPDYLAKNGNRYFFIPNLANRNTKPIKDVMNRVNPVYINRGYVDQDEINYILPEGYKLVTKLINVNVDKPFGKYTVSTQVVGNKLLYKRRLQVNDGTYNKDLYQDLVDFYQLVYDTDTYTLSMEKQ